MMDVIRVQFPSVLNRIKLENKSMVDDKVARRSLWVGELACSSRAYHMKGVMAEWSCEVLLILFTEVQFLLIP